MAQTGFDLISTADIARLAGQSRATVGNWKSRNPDFPPERGRSSRGPLYDRAEVTTWLESTNRLNERPQEVAAMWQLADQLRDWMKIEDAMPLLLLLLALMSQSSTSEWQAIRDASPNDLDSALRNRIQTLFPFADELMPHHLLPAESVARAIVMLSSVDQSRVSLMADALLEQSAKAMGHRGGEYLSPPSVRRLVIALAEPIGSVYNPASGIGQLMIDAATNATSNAVQLIGQEINARVWQMAQLNLAIHGVTAEIALGDVFTQDQFPQLRADRVIAVPPWNQRLLSAEHLMDDPRWVWGEPGPNDGNAAWIQHCLGHLEDNGRAVIVLPNSALFEGGRAGRIRQRIVKAGLLDAVFTLPPGLFAWTALPCSVLVFSKGRRDVEGKPAPTLMVDLSASTDAPGRRSTSLESDLINEVALLYRRWLEGEKPVVEYAAAAAFDELAANDFVIDPVRYLSLPHTAEPDLEETMRNRSRLLDELDRLTKASKDADDDLKKILEVSR
jgi:type I restriction enzyme M protein